MNTRDDEIYQSITKKQVLLLFIAGSFIGGIIFILCYGVNVLNVTNDAWLLAGGIIYTVGGVIYALKLPIFNARHRNFGSHEIFHLFVMAGSVCHFIMMFKYVALFPIG